MSIEKLAEKGIHLVHEAAGLLRFEQVTAAGTKVIEAASAEDALAQLVQHPGATSADISRSDGASELLDAQAGHSAQVGPSDLPTPAADAAAAAPAAEADHTVAPEVVDVAPAPAAAAAPAAEAAPAAPEVES